MNKQIEALRLALEGLEKWHFDKDPRGAADYIAAIHEALAEQPAQQPYDTHAAPGQSFNTHGRTLPAQQQEPVAYDKTEINCFAQDLYDQKMREGKRGHYESMFYVIHQCIKKVSPPASKPWVGLTDEEINYIANYANGLYSLSRAIEAKLKDKNGY